MFWRALMAFLAMPAVVAFAVPAGWLWFGGRLHVVHPPGLVAWVAGVAGLLWCVRDFYVVGKGTLAPWAPPEKLVVVGLYRFSRNPTFVGQAALLAGVAIAVPAVPTVLAPILFLWSATTQVRSEEAALRLAIGPDYDRYAASVPRWIGINRKAEQ